MATDCPGCHRDSVVGSGWRNRCVLAARLGGPGLTALAHLCRHYWDFVRAAVYPSLHWYLRRTLDARVVLRRGRLGTVCARGAG